MKPFIGVSLPAPGSRFELLIEAIDDEGRGRGFHPNYKKAAVDVAVRGAFPGDHTLVVVEKVYAVSLS